MPLYGPEAYSEFYPTHIWDLPSMPKFSVQLDLPKALPGQPFKSPNYALLHGVTLTDPLGAWPATRADIAGSSAFDGSAVNGAAGVDHDADKQGAITDVSVPPGGFISTMPKDDILWKMPLSLPIIDTTNAQMLYRERLLLYAIVLALAPDCV